VLIALMMEAARTSETLVNMDLRTRLYIPEDSELQIKTDQMTMNNKLGGMWQ
jgi:hypothetical protein